MSYDYLDTIGNNIINADCLDILRRLPDKCIDLVLTDPPYGIKISNNMGRRRGDSKSSYKKIDWDSCCPEKEVFDEIFRVSKNQIIFGANYFIDRILKNSSCWIVWDKLFSPEVSFADCELAFTSFSGGIKKYSLSSNQKQRFHPTQKPLKLFEFIIRDFSKRGDIILDCFSGSGTTAIACHKMGRKFICIEKDKDYYEESCKRLQAEKRNRILFYEKELIRAK